MTMVGKDYNTLLKKIAAALEDRDSVAFADCFSKNGKYFDYCPMLNGGEDWVAYGSAGIEMFFRNRFAFDMLSVSDPVIESEKAMTFFGAYNGPYIYALFEIKEIGDDGLIQKAVVYPA